MQKPTLEQWRRLYQAAMELKRLNPWEVMAETDLFGVMNPKTEEIGYCCVTGQLGEYFALNVYLGSEGLNIYLGIASGKIKQDEMLLTMRALTLSFEDADMLQKEDKKIINELDIKFRGRKAYPQFQSYRPGYAPWFLTADEAEYLLLAIEQAIAIVSRFRHDNNLLASPGKNYFLVRALLDKNGGGWRDEWLEPERLNKEENAALKISPQIIARVREIMKQNDSRFSGAWEIDYYSFPQAVKGGNDERPFFPKNLMFVHHDSYFILHSNMFDNPLASINEFADEFIKYLSKEKVFPQSIMVKKSDLYDGLKNICAELGIGLELVKSLRAINDVKKHLSRFWR